ncbi:MAG TPA: hypothetical protein VM032_17735 [Vicinamibacterales bacterium]|nr:hypothetical protein [Vicinamibacterales bacterium]
MRTRPRHPALRRVVATATVMVFGGSASVLACPLCFGAQETSLVSGTRLGMLVLLVIILAMQGAFAGFFIYLRRRAKRIADLDLDIEWSRLQEGTSK